MYKILSLNGGGIKGYLTALVLAHLEDISGKKIGDMFDLVVGSSSGAFLTAGLDAIPASWAATLLRDSMAKRLFKYNHLNFFGMLNTRYDSKARCDVIAEVLEGKQTTRNYDYAILSYDVYNRRPVVFNSLEESYGEYVFTKKYNLTDAVCASSAAPIYWDPYKLDDMLLIDAAFLSNDPTAVGIKLALDGNRSLDDLLILNIGGGLNTRNYNFKSGSNPIKWIVPAFNIMMSSQSQLSRMLYSNEGLCYYSLNGPLNEASDDIDDISERNLKALEREASRLILENDAQINELLNHV